MKLHEKIRAVRKSKGVKQKYIASYLGVSTSTYSAKESGYRRIYAEEVGLIANALNVDPSIFFENVILELRTNKRIVNETRNSA